ncbi:hypothetical protein K490DRAFT_63209 [Saccharata proteae CBS 121410]|uniref:F-box domain-containing protein n=1 Tax=Saccharata proteae CBS 121410 TaxID=1314787 RepID=A0A9P4I058_9PEZI|nr:hypothetical protein K490DRAFT_63209 [Saccharata proteae CBS 121410]
MASLPSRLKQARPTPEPDAAELPKKEPTYLPNEILLEILSHIPRQPSSQPTLASLCLLNWQWYNATVGRLYEKPHLQGSNFDPFMRTVCPSVIAHVKKSDLAGLVQYLDLGSIVHQSSKSRTGRLLSRVKESLVEFVAPQASFGINCFAGLSKCANLRSLNLALVSGAISLYDLARVVKQLPKLEVMYFPRSSTEKEWFKANMFEWPALVELHLGGGLHPQFIYSFGDATTGQSFMPSTLTTLSLTHCPRLDDAAVGALLGWVGPNLKSLTIEDMRQLSMSALDGILVVCSNLTFLRISLDYITIDFLPSETSTWTHPLEHLELSTTNSSTHQRDMFFQPADLSAALDSFPNLRILRVSKQAGWHGDELADDLEFLSSELGEAHKRRADADPSKRKEIWGVWTMNDS